MDGGYSIPLLEPAMTPAVGIRFVFLEIVPGSVVIGLLKGVRSVETYLDRCHALSSDES